MPKILIFKFLQFYFYTQDLTERGHLHIVNNKSYSGAAKIWFEAGVEIFSQGSLTDIQLAQALRVIESELPFIELQWQRFRRQEKLKLKTIIKIKK